MSRSNLAFHQVVGALRDASVCPTCGKPTAVINTARRGFRPERISADTHCACPGGPAYAGVGSTIARLEAGTPMDRTAREIIYAHFALSSGRVEAIYKRDGRIYVDVAYGRGTLGPSDVTTYRYDGVDESAEPPRLVMTEVAFTDGTRTRAEDV